MEAVERAAHISVGRACGFAALGILTFMVGLSYYPALAAQTGGALCLVMTAVLAWRWHTAMTYPYKRTETWLMLEPHERPRESEAQRLIGRALNEVFGWYVRSSALSAVVLFAAALFLSLLPHG